ncbi:hypothetical protein ACQ4WX_41335 [Streptomyces lasalocidi]
MPHWAEFLTLLVTVYSSDRLYSLTVADRFRELTRSCSRPYVPTGRALRLTTHRSR